MDKNTLRENTITTINSLIKMRDNLNESYVSDELVKLCHHVLAADIINRDDKELGVNVCDKNLGVDIWLKSNDVHVIVDSVLPISSDTPIICYRLIDKHVAEIIRGITKTIDSDTVFGHLVTIGPNTLDFTDSRLTAYGLADITEYYAWTQDTAYFEDEDQVLKYVKDESGLEDMDDVTALHTIFDDFILDTLKTNLTTLIDKLNAKLDS